MPTARIEMGISLGSNIGDRAATLIAALARLNAFPGWMCVACSSIYETEPVEVPVRFQDQTYYNAVAVGLLPETEVVPLSDECHRIEAEFGRVRGAERNAPRPLDLDLIYAGSLVWNKPGLQIPHPRWAERRFVVEPLSEIRPGLQLPGQDQTVVAVLSNLPAHPFVRRLAIPGWPSSNPSRTQFGGK